MWNSYYYFFIWVVFHLQLNLFCIIFNTKKIPLKPEILKEFQKCHWTCILQIIKRMILLMTPLTKRNSIILLKAKGIAILKREHMMCLQVLIGSAQDTSFTVPFFYLFYPVLILFGVSHFIYIFAFGDVYPFIFIYHKVVPPLWVAIYTKRLKSKNCKI